MPDNVPTLIRRRWIYALLIFGVLVIAIIFIGLDNIPGLVLGYLATTVLFVAMTYTWRKIRNFIILFFVSLLGIFFLSFLYMEVIYRFAYVIGGVNALQSTFIIVINMIISNVILFAGPVGMLVGIVGSLVLFVRRIRDRALRGT